MAAPYSDDPDAPIEGWNSDFPTFRTPADPPDAIESLAAAGRSDLLDGGDYDFDPLAAPELNVARVPPVASLGSSFPSNDDLENIAPVGNALEIEMASSPGGTRPYSDDPRSARYMDEPDRYMDDPHEDGLLREHSDSYHDGEFDSVFVDGDGRRMSRLSWTSKSASWLPCAYHRKTIGTCFLGFFLGLILMIVIVLLTVDRGGDSRLGQGASFFGGNGNVNGVDGSGHQPLIDANSEHPLGKFDGKNEGDGDTLSIWVAGLEPGEEEEGDDKRPFRPENGGEAVASNNEEGSGNEKGDDAAEGSGVETTKVQEPQKGEGQGDLAGEDAAAEDTATDPAKETPKDPAAESAKEEPVPAPAKDAPKPAPLPAPKPAPAKPAAADEAAAKDQQAIADAHPTKHDDKAADDNEIVPVEGRDDPDITQFCASCHWKGTPYTCTQRIEDLFRRFKLSEREAKTNLMKQGHCPEISGREPVKVVPGRENPNVSEFCGGCKWKGTRINCNQRVKDLWTRFKVPTEEARTNLMKQGHCPPIGGKDAVVPFLDPNLIPKFEDCRTRPVPGKDNFCVHCIWKGSEYSCYERVAFLKSKYGTPETVSMPTLMRQGHCKDDMTDEERAKNKELGLEFWCGGCKFRGKSCDQRASADGLVKDEETLVNGKLNLLGNGQCKMPPYCDAKDGDGGR